MAGRDYSFVIDSYFRPFSMQELLYPFLEYREAYNKLDDAYYDMQSKMDKFKYLRDLPETSIARQIYDNYYNDFNRSASEFYERGLYPGNRRAFSNLRRRYAGEIGRLEEADLKKRTQMQEQHTMSLQDPTKLYSRDAASTSLDAYIENPDLTYNAYSGALLAQQVGTAAAAIAKGLSNYGSGKKLDKFTNTFIQQHGFTKEEVAQAVANPRDPNNAKVLNALVEDVVGSSGIAAWNDPVTLDKAYKFASMGLWNAVGETKLERYEDYGARLAAQTAATDRLNARQHARTMAAARAVQNNGGAARAKFNKRRVFTDEEMGKVQKDREMWNKYSKYFRKINGHWVMTVEGREYYKKGKSFGDYNMNLGSYMGMGPYPTSNKKWLNGKNKPDYAINRAGQYTQQGFKEWVDSHGLSEMAQGRHGKWQSGQIDNMLGAISGITDGIQHTEIVGQPINTTNYDNVISIMGQAAPKGQLPTVSRTKENGEYIWKADAKPFDMTKLNKDNIRSIYPVQMSGGDVMEVVFKDGSRIDVPVRYLNEDYANLMRGNWNEAMESYKEDPITATQSLNMGVNNFNSLFGNSTIEPDKIVPGMYTGGW